MNNTLLPLTPEDFTTHGLTDCTKHGNTWLVYDTISGLSSGSSAVVDCDRCRFERENYDEDGCELGDVAGRMIEQGQWDAAAWVNGFDSWKEMREAQVEDAKIEQGYQSAAGWAV